MRRIIIMLLAVGFVVLIYLFFTRANFSHVQNAPTPQLATPHFSDEANEIFTSSIAGNIDLNSGLSMERATPLYLSQINNVTFAVFNHTDEPINFPNQGFGLTVFRYDDINKIWEKLQLQHVPYSQPTTLPPKIETWNSETDNSWDILEDDAMALGYEEIRLYIWGNGKVTNKTYGAYLDVTISELP